MSHLTTTTRHMVKEGSKCRVHLCHDKKIECKQRNNRSISLASTAASRHFNLFLGGTLPQHTGVEAVIFHLSRPEPQRVIFFAQSVAREDDGLLEERAQRKIGPLTPTQVM